MTIFEEIKNKKEAATAAEKARREKVRNDLHDWLEDTVTTVIGRDEHGIAGIEEKIKEVALEHYDNLDLDNGIEVTIEFVTVKCDDDNVYYNLSTGKITISIMTDGFDCDADAEYSKKYLLDSIKSRLLNAGNTVDYNCGDLIIVG